VNSERAILGLFVIALAAGTGAGASEAGKAAPAAPGITASLPARYTTSRPLREVAPLREAGKKVRVMPAHRIPRERLSREAPPVPQPDAALQTAAPRAGMPSPVRDFEGVSNVNGVLPPDTDGDVGPDHYLQIVNLSFQIFDKATGASVYGPAANNTLWASLGGICASNNDGDPIVMYDSYAGRWVFSQFALDFPDNFHECVAVSASSDPTGSWYLYDFQISTAKMNDYPKLGVWPDGYYMSVNQFDGATSAWAGVGAVAFERDQMLVGGPAQMIYLDLFPTSPHLACMLPADADGLLPPPAGTPSFFVQVDNDSWGFPQDQLEVWEFHVDWATPGNSTFTPSSTSPLAVSAWTVLCSGTRSCVPQPGTAQGLDAIGDRLMYRLQYRNFGTHESMVVNHTVDAGGGGAGVRWYELRDAGAGWSLHQEGTYAGDGGPDGENRWMGSIAMDQQGNMALGYSVSSASTYPSIRYVGRLAGDPLNTLPQGETPLVAGSGSQTHSSARWGDYSSMTVDPDDDCTFWYTQEYYAATSSAGWQTRVGSFRFPGCTSGPSGTLNGTVTAAAGGAPIEGARIDIGPYATYTGAAGTYGILLPVGTYDVTASRWGYAPGAAPAVDVIEGVTTTQDFSLAQAPGHTVHGTVTDAATGWPLYAEVDYTHGSAWTDPLTGGYSVVLPEGSYTLQVTDFAGAYEPASSPVTADADRQVDFALSADASCTAAGYAAVTALDQDLDACALPAGWAVVNNGGGCTWAFDDPGGRGNLTGGAGCFAVADSDLCGSGTRMDTDLVSPSVNLSSLAEVTLEFRYDVYDFSGGTVCEVDVSTDGGSAWTSVWSRSGASDRGPATARVDLTALAAGEADVKVRFHYEGDYQWWWEVDDVAVFGPCTAPADGGLVLGSVRDGNTGTALVGATVEAGPGHAATTVATPEDDSLDDGFYTLFVPTAGAAALSAGAPGGYGPQDRAVAVPLLGTVWQDFALPAGSLGAVPDAVEVSILQGGARSVPVSLDNAGLLEAEFELAEINAPVPARPHGPFAPATRHMSPKGLSDLDTSAARYVFPRPASPVVQAAGDVVQSWPSGLALPWGAGHDNRAGEVWLGNPAAGGGDDLDRGFLPSAAWRTTRSRTPSTPGPGTTTRSRSSTGPARSCGRRARAFPSPGWPSTPRRSTCSPWSTRIPWPRSRCWT